MKSARVLTLALVLAASVFAAPVTFTFTTPVGGTIGGTLNIPIHATVSFAPANDHIFVTITNLFDNPTTDAQNIGSVIFDLSIGQPASYSLASSSGTQRTILADGSYTVGPTESTRWVLRPNSAHLPSPGFELCLICSSGTAVSQAPYTIIGGPAAGGQYTAANNSIAGSIHNPFIYRSAIFDLAIAGVTAATTFSNVQMAFGTGFELSQTTGTELVDDPNPVPEPGWLALAGLALLLAAHKFRA